MQLSARQIGTSDRAELQAELRRAGLRATASRLAVFDALRAAGSPVSHGEVADALASFGWDRTTIYRNLLDLTRVGLSRRLDLGDHIWRFEPADGEVAGLHWRFVCTECGEVQDLGGLQLAVDDDAQVPLAVREQQAELQVRGLCDGCTTMPGESAPVGGAGSEPA